LAGGKTSLQPDNLPPVIAGAHTILYAEDAAVARAFLRDKLGFDFVDSGDGWLIFALPPGELACHTADRSTAGTADLFLMCKDVNATRSELEAKGVEFVGPITNQRWGLVTRLKVPGFGELGLYEPLHESVLPAFK
jgi:catechol 2,3-dioxygenase-like lactoylglutathione lyase family enzyme